MTAGERGGFSLQVPANIVVKTDPGKSEWNSLHQLTSAYISLQQLTTAYNSLQQLTTAVTAGGFSLCVLVNIVLDMTFTGPHHRPIFMYFALRPICNPLTKRKKRDV